MNVRRNFIPKQDSQYEEELNSLQDSGTSLLLAILAKFEGFKIPLGYTLLVYRLYVLWNICAVG